MTKPTADPLSLIRKIRLQEFCKRKGWWDPMRQMWMVKESGDFFGKHRQKMSDLLGGRGSFGAKIARELEQASGGELPAGYLDDLGSFIQPNMDAVRRANEAIMSKVTELKPPEAAEHLADALGDALQGLPAALYDRSVTACRRLAESPDSQRARAELWDVLQHSTGLRQHAGWDARVRQQAHTMATSHPDPAVREILTKFVDALDSLAASASALDSSQAAAHQSHT